MTTFEAVHSPKQIAEVALLAREIWQEHYVPIIGQKQVDYMLNTFQSEKAITSQCEGDYEYFLIVHNEQNVGYVAIVQDISSPVCMLSKIYVHHSVRGLGLGKQALQFVEELCHQRGITKIWLTVNKHNANSIAWYIRMGFKNTEPIVQDIGGGFIMDDFKFEKTIS